MSAATLFLILATNQYSVGKNIRAVLMTELLSKVREMVISGAIVFFPAKSGAKLSLKIIKQQILVYAECTSSSV